MHQPETAPRKSVFYDYRIHPFLRPPEMEGQASDVPVVIVGAGPIGLVAALDLARWGVRSIILESELQVSHGSRAIVLTRRSLEILQQVGLSEQFMAKGLPWDKGRSFYRGRQVYEMLMPHNPDDRYLPGLNIQQQYIEEILVTAVENSPLIDLRWGSHVTALAQDKHDVSLTVDTPDGEYLLHSPWVIAADGGRSTIRRLLDLRMEGRSYPGNFVIADIVANINLPTERLCYFDPDWNPGNNVLVHRQPESLWRIDFRLPDGESAEQALKQDVLAARIDSVLAMIGYPGPWMMDWATVYSANTLTLPDYRKGRVLLTGDAAHLLPIFGVRGANTGFQDATNLTWKLALVVQGKADASLLDSYSQERVAAAREICEEGGRSTRFMTPPTAGYKLMRDAVLSLSLSEDFCRGLLHWRTSRPHDYLASALNSFPADDADFVGGPTCGAPVPNLKLGEDDYLLNHFGLGYHLLMFAESTEADWIEAMLAAADSAAVPVKTIVVGGGAGSMRGRCTLSIGGDAAARMAAKFAAGGGTAYLVRPDMHVAARWRAADKTKFEAALEVARGNAIASAAAPAEQSKKLGEAVQ